MKKNSIERLKEYQIKSGYTPVDLNEYETFLERCIPSDFPETQRSNIKNEVLDELRSIAEQLPTEYQDPHTFKILQPLIKKIHRAAITLSKQTTFTFPNKLTYGTASIAAFTAFVEASECEQDYLLLISDNLFLFAHLLSKSIGMLTIDNTLEKLKSEKFLQFNYSKDHIDCSLKNNHEAIVRFTDLILAYSITNKASYAKQYTPDLKLARISSLLLNSFELFVVGHEYSHLLLGHFFNQEAVKEDEKKYVQLNDEKIETIFTNWSQEIEADVLAAHLAITAMEGYDIACSYIGVDISLITLIILDRLETELKGKTIQPITHPPSEVRRQIVYERLSNSDKDIKKIYTTNTYIIDALWNRCMYIIKKIDEILRKKAGKSLINIPYPLTQTILYTIGNHLLSEFEETNQ